MRKNRMIVFTLLMICLLSLPAFGNAASPYEDPVANSVTFNDDTGIVLKEEWVKFTIDENSRKSHVEVVYKLVNEDRDDSELEIMFLAPYFNYESEIVHGESFKVAVDGIPISDFEVKESEGIPENWRARNTVEIMEPVDGRRLDESMVHSRIYSRDGKVKGILFYIDIEKGRTRQLVMSYESEGGYYSYGDVVNDVHTQLYYLTPAKFWNGDPLVNLEIVFPDGGYKVHSSIDMEKVSSTNYKARLTGLPDEEWSFSYVDTTWLFYGTNRRSVHNTITWIIIAVTVLTGLYVRKRKKWKGNLILLLILPELFLFRPGYGILYLLYFLIAPVTALVVFVVLVMMILRQYNKRKSDRSL